MPKPTRPEGAAPEKRPPEKRPRTRKRLPRAYFNTGTYSISVEHSRESHNKGEIDESFVAAVEAASSEFFRVAWPEEGKPAARAASELFKLRPLSEYQDDYGTVLWWHLPIQEPPYVGSGPGMGDKHRDGRSTACARLLADGWLTHWSPIPQPELKPAADRKGGA